jgi:prepilin-type N-terminal cleavage/methylation domain-containing protein
MREWANTSRKYQSGFTLIELLIFIGIIGLLAVCLWSAISGGKAPKGSKQFKVNAQKIEEMKSKLAGKKPTTAQCKLLNDYVVEAEKGINIMQTSGEPTALLVTKSEQKLKELKEWVAEACPQGN